MSQRRPRCRRCGSRQWAQIDGLWACSNGHQQDVLDVRNDEFQAGGVGRQIRQRRGNRGAAATDDDEELKDQGNSHLSKYYLRCQEKRADFKFRAHQVALQMLVKDLQKAWELPDEYEKTVRTIWLEVVSLQPALDRNEATRQAAEILVNLNDIDSDSEEEDDGHDDQLDAFNVPAHPSIAKAVAATALKNGTTLPTFEFADALAILYIACVFHGVPVILFDFVRMALSAKLRHLNVLDWLPDDICTRYKSNFQPIAQTIPEVHLQMVRMKEYIKVFEDQIPPRSMALYVDRFAAELSLHDKVAVLAKKILSQYKPESFAFEYEVMAAIVVSLKLCYGVVDVENPAYEAWHAKCERFLRQRAKTHLPWSPLDIHVVNTDPNGFNRFLELYEMIQPVQPMPPGKGPEIYGYLSGQEFLSFFEDLKTDDVHRVPAAEEVVVDEVLPEPVIDPTFSSKYIYFQEILREPTEQKWREKIMEDDLDIQVPVYTKRMAQIFQVCGIVLGVQGDSILLPNVCKLERRIGGTPR